LTSKPEWELYVYDPIRIPKTHPAKLFEHTRAERSHAVFILDHAALDDSPVHPDSDANGDSPIASHPASSPSDAALQPRLQALDRSPQFEDFSLPNL